MGLPQFVKEGPEKKEYLVNLSLPDINNGIYGTDDFKMYTFKVKPCSRAYSHDWTECPFVHPGENARRRDLRKYPYICVPCPEFLKGACPRVDACEYAHELHPVNASTGSTMPSPSSTAINAVEIANLSPLALVAAAVMNSRFSEFAKRSQSFIYRGAMTGRAGLTATSTTMMSSNISDWSSPDGKLDWGIQGDELNRLRKSASFGFRNNNPTTTATTNMMASNANGPDVSWVHSIVRDGAPTGERLQRQQRYSVGKDVQETFPPWMEQMYIEQEQVA
ncbi:zinc finger CCCH domain-containing protein 29-like isoform 2 [Hibiscus syriacus]|uniref:Zinc finger CCCH domain-containing protein 29-like isoform 2 n=1 Tax=Hibiscus syriacus TaxID=106335 RepID=A0A6A3APC3_HIBSY|nr:zinc finger CCCH domain-containing protein 29-like isoform 2 [Hibiscus syriacus]KAE8711171.1 zinc finger CCCH domain-containing protein 29-like isoform 2 [Hibiscus syriacus]